MLLPIGVAIFSVIVVCCDTLLLLPRSFVQNDWICVNNKEIPPGADQTGVQTGVQMVNFILLWTVLALTGFSMVRCPSQRGSFC
jgi:hypothetical protein